MAKVTSKKAVNQATNHKLRVAHITILIAGILITWSGFDGVRIVVDAEVKYSPDWQIPAYMILFGASIMGVAISNLFILNKNNGKK